LEKGFVSRKESTDDRRYQDVELTAKGKTLVPELAKIADQNDEEFFSNLSKAERKQLKSLLQTLADHHQLKTVPID
jgi:DNA-binding MarR family transcriptional regulator